MGKLLLWTGLAVVVDSRGGRSWSETRSRVEQP
jgi:hypothetical protein